MRITYSPVKWTRIRAAARERSSAPRYPSSTQDATQFSSSKCQMDNASAVIHTIDAPKRRPRAQYQRTGRRQGKLPLARRASHPSIALSAPRALVSPSAYRSEVRNSKHEPQTLRSRKDLCTVIRRPPSQRHNEVRLSSLVPAWNYGLSCHLLSASSTARHHIGIPTLSIHSQ